MSSPAFVESRTSRPSNADVDLGRDSHAMPDDYDDKDDLSELREKLAARKKPIAIGLGFLALAIIGTTVAVSTGGSTQANTKSAGRDETIVEATTPPPTTAPVESDSSVVDQNGKVAAPSSWSRSGSSSNAGSSHNEAAVISVTQATNSSSNAPTTATPTTTPTPTTDGPQLPYKDLEFDWKNPSNWEKSGGGGVPSGVISDSGIKLTPATSAEPIRTKQGWDGEKIVLIEWERSEASDTNIWMLNTKLQSQFGAGNGWPYWGEIDIFEMFTQDKLDKGSYDFSGAGQFTDVASYGQLTMHMGPPFGQGDPCFCASAGHKGAWYQGSQPMTSSCTAQFANTAKNSIATVWGSDGNGKYIQLIQNPSVTKGGKTSDGKTTYDISSGSGTVTPKIYNNANSFWGVPPSSPCAKAGGFNPNTGFPFFESFRIILEEQKKGGDAWFKVNNIQIFKKN